MKEIYDHVAILIQDPKDGKEFKVNGQRLMIYFENKQLEAKESSSLLELELKTCYTIYF